MSSRVRLVSIAVKRLLSVQATPTITTQPTLLMTFASQFEMIGISLSMQLRLL